MFRPRFLNQYRTARGSEWVDQIISVGHVSQEIARQVYTRRWFVLKSENLEVT